MLKQVLILLAVAAVALALGDGKPFYSKKTAQQQQQHQYASVTSYHSNKVAPAPQFQPAPQPQVAPSPYSFGYEAEGSARQESSDGSGKVTGSYKVTNEDGSVRVVKYVADDQGFRADIDTNEAGTKSSNPSNVAVKSAFVEPPAPAHPAPQRYVAPVQPAPQKYAQPSTSYGGQYEQKPIQFNMGSNQGAYSFNYEAQLEDGGSSAHSENADGSGKVSGYYSLSGADGRRRQVDYSSGTEGFQAKVETNEFGTKSESPANVQFYSSAPQPSAPATSNFAKTTSFQQQTQRKTYAAAPVQQQPIQPVFYATSPAKPQPVQAYAQQPSPYAFSYDAQLEDGSSSRKESADASGKVVGSYSLATADGRQRTIHYTADHEGFRASVDTNEFGTKSDSPADVQFNSNAPKEAPAPSVYSAGAQFSQKRIPTAFPVEQTRVNAGQIKTAMQSQTSYQGQTATQYNNAAAIEQFAPFAFNYIAELEDGTSSRSESGDASGKVVGSYSLSGNDGRKRTVDYLADQGGFRATVNTNEFGTKSDSPADIQFYSSAPQVEPQAPSVAAPSYKTGAGKFQAGSSGSHFQSGAGYYAASAGQHKTSFATQQRIEPQQYQPSPYSFGYQAEAATGGGSARSESSDASGKVTGSYTVKNEDGSVRVVDYIADKDGFRANVKTNEAGTKSDNPADVSIKSNAPAPSAPIQQQHVGKATFPAATYTPKTSQISQKSISAWTR
ncbi:uncharacterized protein CEXT_524031 [Caerostris extrusa]|uniref:Uncharacterized protein n=1 Tax=Caerostris extrusa TaxID=172846 RepID=A0AAV4P817_CAEEX|nr:uncharacterized protein CEXT_524031 [Caerostris extrusa]